MSWTDITKNRFASASWAENTKKIGIAIIGVGGIGSWTALFLKRADFEVSVMDEDKVELTNLGGQLFTIRDIGRYKTVAVDDLVYNLTGSSLTTYTERFNTSSHFLYSSIVISAVDNVETRYNILDTLRREALNDNFNSPKILIDAGLEAEFFTLRTINILDEKEVEEYLGELDELENVKATMCSYKQTTHVAAILAGMITTQAVNIAHNLTNEIKRPIHKHLVYNATYNKVIQEKYREDEIWASIQIK